MDRIGAAGGAPLATLANGQQGRQDQNLAAGVEGTLDPSLYSNALQEEIMSVLAAANVTPNINIWNQLWQSICTLIGTRPTGMQAFGLAGTSSWTPPAFVYNAFVLVIGGGGSGGGGNGYSGFGGGSAGMAMGFVAVTPGVPMSVLVGAGAPVTASNSSGSTGGTSSFGGISATGGGGGTVGSASPSAGTYSSVGYGYNGALNVSGTVGDAPNLSTTILNGGDGGNGIFSGGGKGGFGATGGEGGITPGAGGGGGANSTTGGQGATGLVLIVY